MLRISSRILTVALVVSVAGPLFAVTYIVPTDREMVQRSDDIVIATGVTSIVERTARGGIVTRYVLRIDESLKGKRSQNTYLTLTEIGGRLGDQMTFMSGMPVYVPGEQYLVFTETNREGEPITFGLQLGQFWFELDVGGGKIAVRNVLCGFDQNLEPFSEGVRDARGFLDYIRGIAEQRIAPEPAYFVHSLHKHESDFRPVVTGGLDEVGSGGVAIGAWNGAGAGISYSDGGDDPTATGGFTRDFKNAVLFNDPNGEVPTGVGGLGGITHAEGTHTLDGEEFFNTAEVDVVINNNFSPALNSCLYSVVTHEIGHTLSLRHADQSPEGGSCNSATAECSSSAIMTAITNCSHNGNLQTWDVNAANALYGSGTPPFPRSSYTFINARWESPSATIVRNTTPCTPPSINTHPGSVEITQGDNTTLTVAAAGTALTYQWYIGTNPDTSLPTGTNSASLQVSPTLTTSYWVKVSGQCGTPMNSNTATVTVNCVAPSINTHPQSVRIFEGDSTALFVAASGSGLSYQWFIGNSGDESQPTGTNSNTLNVSPATDTSYWVKVSGTCGAPVNSNTATVTVTPCPEVIVETPIATKQPNGSYVLTVSAGSDGRPLTYQWFRGNTPGVGGTPLGAGTSIAVPAPTGPTTYWVRVQNDCGKSAVSPPKTIDDTCDLPAINAQPADQSIASGGSATLSVAFTPAAGATVRWYRGTAPDKGNQVGTGTSFNTGALTTATSFFASITNSCGEVLTRTAIVSISCGAPSVTQPPDQTVTRGRPATITVVATGSGPLTYQWYQGALGVVLFPVGTSSATLVTAPLTSATQFWVLVKNACGEAFTQNIQVNVNTPKRRSARS